MSWDSVPWFVGGGAEHSPEVARLLAYAATGGAEGVVSPGDLKVLPLDVPGASVRISIGAALIRNRAAGGTAQTYVARNPIEDVTAIAATGSAGGRSDLIVAQIEDPFMAGEPWQDPTDPKVGPYIFTRVISNVPAGTRRLQDVPGYEGRSAITLARVDLPASTGTVTGATIVDLRKVALPRSVTSLTVLGAVGGTLAATAETAWPTNVLTLDVPEWATRVKGTVTLTGVTQSGGNEASSHRLRIGSALYSDATAVSIEADSPQRVTLTIPVTMPIPAAMRGTSQTLTVLSRRTSAGLPGRFFISNTKGSVASVDLIFEEAVS